MNEAIERITRLFGQLSDDELLHVIDLIEDELASRDEKTAEEKSGRVQLPRLSHLLDWGVISIGDRLIVRGHDVEGKKATLVDAKNVEYRGKRVSCYAWAKEIAGWKSIRVYDWVVVERNGKLLGEIRKDEMLKRGMKYPE